MSKTPSMTPEKIIQLLKKKGFALDRIKGSHHIYLNIATSKRVIVSLHRKDIPR